MVIHVWKAAPAASAALGVVLALSPAGPPDGGDAGLRRAAAVGVFPTSLRPAVRAVASGHAAGLGVQLVAARDGTVTAIQFYRAADNTGPHPVRLWDADGDLLGRGRSRAGRPGWTTVPLRRPVTIRAGRRFVASYVAPRGHWSSTPHAAFPYRAHGLRAVAGVRGPRRGMPTRRSRTNYLVDVEFAPSASSGAVPPPSGPTTTAPPSGTPTTPPPTGPTTTAPSSPSNPPSSTSPTSPTTVTSSPPATVTPLALPRIPWEGGPAYWSQFPKAHQSGWDDPSFFPVSVFYGKPEHAHALHDLGINTYMGAEHDGTDLHEVTNEGMFVLAQQEEFTPAEVGDNPGVVGWFISDECEMGYSGCPEGPESANLAQQRAYVDRVHSFDDGRFTEANFGNGILRTYWAPTTMDEHVQLMDAASADKYTYTSPHIWDLVPTSPDWPDGATVRSAASYGWQADQMKRFQDPAHLRPIWTFVETAMPLLDEPGAVTITPDQLEGAVWSAIIHEARGVAFFQHNNNGQCGNYSLLDCGPELRAKVTEVTNQIRDLAPIINSQSYVYDFHNGTDTMLKADATDAYIFAGIGLLQSPGTKTFRLPPGVSGTTVSVVGENRTLPVTDGTFTDDFAAEYTHHVYRIAR